MENNLEQYDRSEPMSIFGYSRHLIGNSLRSLFGDEVVERSRKGKGGLGQMVEECFFKYNVNSSREADFAEAHVEVKCTPLLRSSNENGYRIKERLVCTMIDYFSIVNTSFEDSHFLDKCRLMLLLFYLHVSGNASYDYKFLFRVLWQLPEKDLIMIKQDYQTIVDKVRRGEVHLLSEGDTIYLGACRKGQRGDDPQSQPFSEIKANKRAFSLKPAYMRYVLSHVVNSGKNYYTNYAKREKSGFELVTEKELYGNGLEQIILNRFQPYIGLNYIEICSRLDITPYQAKSKYADVAGLIASNGKSKRLSASEEFVKSGVVMKTIRLNHNGMPKESMSFKNIDFCAVYDNDEWVESEAYEVSTNRFMFVVFKPTDDKIEMTNNRNQSTDVEQSYLLDSVFFWTMPSEDLELARDYWLNIRHAVLANNIRPEAFWSIGDHKKFHVRPKARRKSDCTVNPNGGLCEKYCYWFNADYVKRIIDSKVKK